jgi:hypothetical protein
LYELRPVIIQIEVDQQWKTHARTWMSWVGESSFTIGVWKQEQGV